MHSPRCWLLVGAAMIALTACHLVGDVDGWEFDPSPQGGATAGGGASAGSGSTGGGSAGAGGHGGSATAGGGGCSNQVLVLAGAVDDFVVVGDSPELDALDEFTIEAWIRPGAKLLESGANGEMHVLAHQHHQNNQGWVLLVKDQQLEFRSYNVSLSLAAGGIVAVDKWAHVAGVYEAGQLRTYVNGQAGGVQTAGVAADYGGPLRIGASAYHDRYRFEGRIDDVRISSIARYSGDFTPPSGPLAADGDTVALWRFEGSTSTVNDDAGPHAGMLNGMASRAVDACPLVAE